MNSGTDQVKAMAEETESATGATLDLPHDRVTIERFRQAFPRARWSKQKRAWFVPGRTAHTRIGRFLERLEAKDEAFADEKGRDAFAFDPIRSRYLEAGSAALLIRTPYSRRLIAEIREIDGARWDPEGKLWTVPYRSLEDLRHHWPQIETIAAESEPEARQERLKALRGTEEGEAKKARHLERRRRRYPVPVTSMPPIDRAISTEIGVVFFLGGSGELADAKTIETFYFPPVEAEDYVWVDWRAGTLAELVTTWPARSEPTVEELERGWWLPTLDDLRIARRDARSREKVRQRRSDKDGLR